MPQAQAKAQHTPGPWFRYTMHPDRFTVGNYAPSGTCRVTADCSPRECVTGCGDETMSEDECEANARLIAAAPELLKLAEYVDLMSEEADRNPILGPARTTDDYRDMLGKLARSARAAIAKATGSV